MPAVQVDLDRATGGGGHDAVPPRPQLSALRKQASRAPLKLHFIVSDGGTSSEVNESGLVNELLSKTVAFLADFPYNWR